MAKKGTDYWGRPYSDRTKGKKKGFFSCFIILVAGAASLTLVVGYGVRWVA